MDFNLDETQTELRTLTAGLFAREVTSARLEAHEGSGQPYDAGLWKSLAQAGVLGACLPEEAGGAGLGAVEMAVILREAGAAVAPVPLLPSLVAALTIGLHGSPAQRAALAPLAEGEITLTYAVREAPLPGARHEQTLASPARSASVTEPPPDASGAAPVAGVSGAAPVPGGSGAGPVAGGSGAQTSGSASPITAAKDGRLTGRVIMVANAQAASRMLVPATTPDGVALFLVDPAETRIQAMPFSTGEPGAVVTLEATPGEMIGAPDGSAWETLRLASTAGITATASGVLAGALELTTGYIKTRKQFDRALAEFQAVTVQIADVYIAARALDVAVWSGAWRLAEGLPAQDDLALAALHTTDSALKALYTCQHLHGGIGLDVTYPLHRYFAWGKHAAHTLGGPQAQLDLIGALI